MVRLLKRPIVPDVRPGYRVRIDAVHEIDLEKVLGAPLRAEWTCSSCGAMSRGLPAAYVKRAAGMIPICLNCLKRGAE